MSSNEPVILNFDHAKQRALAIDYIKRLRGPHRFDVRKVRETRSNAQNALLWGWIYPRVAAGLMEATGEPWSNEATHTFCKDRFASEDVIDKSTGEVIGKRTLSTAKMDTKRFSQFIDDITKFSAEYLSVDIPSPQEMGYAA